MTVDALGGGTALTSSLASLTGSARDRARAQPPEAAEENQRSAEVKAEPDEPAAGKEPAEDAKSIAEIASGIAEEARETVPTQLSILYDRDIDLFISRRVDRESGEIVRQFPYEDHLERLRTLNAQRDEDSSKRLDLSV